MTDRGNDGPSGEWRPDSPDVAPKTMTDLLALPDAERSLMNWLVRKRCASFAEMQAQTGESPETLHQMLNGLVQAGFLAATEDSDGAVFKPNLVSRKTRSLPKQVWDALG